MEGPSDWVGTQQAARSLGVSPRTVRWHIEQGHLVAKPQGEGVRRAWLVSIDSLQAFKQARQDATGSPQSDRVSAERGDIAGEDPGNPIRELAYRLAEEAARAAEYRVRLELTEQAQSSLEEELAAERTCREQAQRERDELRQMLGDRAEATGGSETASEEPYSTHAPPVPERPVSGEQQPSQRRSSWWRRFFGFE
jgi:hypothetical protein